MTNLCLRRSALQTLTCAPVLLLAACGSGGRPQVASKRPEPAVTFTFDLVEPLGNPPVVGFGAQARFVGRPSHDGTMEVGAARPGSDERNPLALFEVMGGLDASVTMRSEGLPAGRVTIDAILRTSNGIEIRGASWELEIQRDLSACEPPADGCAECAAGETIECYSLGLEHSTRDQGECRTGVRHCGADGLWGSCVEEALPEPEACESSPVDLDCDGAPGCEDAACNAAPTCESEPSPCAPADCTDARCDGISCLDAVGGAGRCRTGACVAREAECADGADDDGDGWSDCTDPDCEGKECGGTLACQSGICAPGEETLCSNGLDDDGNAATDCDDPSCEGRVCSGGRCMAGACATAEVDCGDGADDDGDGTTDCGDSECDDDRCGEGTLCRSGSCVSESEIHCGDAADDDGDGEIDCVDADCGGAPCGNGPGGQPFVCRMARCVPAAEIDCADGADDDADGVGDCADADCPADTPCAPSKICRNTLCVPPTETSCQNAVDDNADGKIDCADAECPTGTACGSGRLCRNKKCVYPTETNCKDGVDNDEDGVSDCVDPDCETRECNKPSFVCAAGKCTVPGCSCHPGYISGPAANQVPVVGGKCCVNSVCCY